MQSNYVLNIKRRNYPKEKSSVLPTEDTRAPKMCFSLGLPFISWSLIGWEQLEELHFSTLLIIRGGNSSFSQMRRGQNAHRNTYPYHLYTKTAKYRMLTTKTRPLWLHLAYASPRLSKLRRLHCIKYPLLWDKTLVTCQVADELAFVR